MNSIKKCQCYASPFRLFPSTSLWFGKTDEAILPPAGPGPTHYPQFSREMGKLSLTTFEQISIALVFLLLMSATMNHPRNLWQMKCNVFKAALLFNSHFGHSSNRGGFYTRKQFSRITVVLYRCTLNKSFSSIAYLFLVKQYVCVFKKFIEWFWMNIVHVSFLAQLQLEEIISFKSNWSVWSNKMDYWSEN